MPIVSIYSHKGGQGVTTIAATLATLTANAGHRTLIIDTGTDQAAIHGLTTDKWAALGDYLTTTTVTLDDITTNIYSDWIDTFTPLNHQHVWSRHTAYYRRYWFGGTSIACGGIATIPRIYEQRSSLGELDTQKLAARFHEVIKGQSAKIDFGELDSFTKAVVDDPRSLLKNDETN